MIHSRAVDAFHIAFSFAVFSSVLACTLGATHFFGALARDMVEPEAMKAL